MRVFGNSGRGGKRRATVEESVDDGVLLDIFGRHADKISSFGIYEHQSTSSQPCGKGLLALKEFILETAQAKPSCELPIGDVKKALGRLVFTRASVNKSIYNNQLWRGLRQERVTCILNHVRRLRRDEDRLRQVCLKLTASETLALQNLLSSVKLGSGAGTGDQAQDSDQETVFHEETSDKRSLKQNSSDVSVDSLGFPKMFDSPRKVDDSLGSAGRSEAATAMQANMKGSRAEPAARQLSKRRRSSKGADVSADDPVAAEPRPPRPVPVQVPVPQPPRSAAAVHHSAFDKSYTKMFYKSNNSFGLRQAFGEKKQVISVCKKGVAKIDLENVADRALIQLNKGTAVEADVKLWVQDKLAQL